MQTLHCSLEVKGPYNKVIPILSSILLLHYEELPWSTAIILIDKHSVTVLSSAEQSHRETITEIELVLL